MTRSRRKDTTNKELREQEEKLKKIIEQKDRDIKKLKQQIKELKQEPIRTKKETKRMCPKCSSDLIVSSIPAGRLSICKNKCGFVELKK